MQELLLKFSNLLGMLLFQVIDLSFVFEYLSVKFLLKMPYLIVSTSHLLVQFLQGLSHSLSLAMILAILSL